MMLAEFLFEQKKLSNTDIIINDKHMNECPTKVRFFIGLI